MSRVHKRHLKGTEVVVGDVAAEVAKMVECSETVGHSSLNVSGHFKIIVGGNSELSNGLDGTNKRARDGECTAEKL